MSAKPSPSNFPDPFRTSRSNRTAPTHARRTEAFASSAPGRLTPRRRARRTLCFASASKLPCFRREPATVTERAMRPALPQGCRNSRFRFEVPARIACQGDKCRRPRCDQLPGCANTPAQLAARLRFPLKPGENQALDSLMRISQVAFASKFRRPKHENPYPILNGG